jgi:hypothetical protein
MRYPRKHLTSQHDSSEQARQLSSIGLRSSYLSVPRPIDCRLHSITCPDLDKDVTLERLFNLPDTPEVRAWLYNVYCR